MYNNSYKVLHFSRPGFSNTTLVDAKSGKEEYLVKSQAGSGLGGGLKKQIIRTEQGFVSESEREVVSIETNGTFRSDKVKFSICEPIKLKDWLKDDSFYDPLRANDTHPPRYQWIYTSSIEMVLAPKGDINNPIAWFKTEFPGKHPAMLTLSPAAEAFQDAVVAALILVANKYLARNQSGAARAAGITGQIVGTVVPMP